MTELDQCSFETALRSDLASARQENGMLRDQIREANTLNEALSYKVDFLTQEIGRVTASREQYERISIRVSTIGESVVKVAMGQLQSLLDEIRAAAFTQVPGAVKSAPEASKPTIGAGLTAPEFIGQVGINGEVPGYVMPHMIASGIGGPVFDSASLLPPARLGNGEVK